MRSPSKTQIQNTPKCSQWTLLGELFEPPKTHKTTSLEHPAKTAQNGVANPRVSDLSGSFCGGSVWWWSQRRLNAATVLEIVRCSMKIVLVYVHEL